MDTKQPMEQVRAVLMKRLKWADLCDECSGITLFVLLLVLASVGGDQSAWLLMNWGKVLVGTAVPAVLVLAGVAIRSLASQHPGRRSPLGDAGG